MDDRTSFFHEILIKNLEREKSEFEDRKCCECRSALACMCILLTGSVVIVVPRYRNPVSQKQL